MKLILTITILLITSFNIQADELYMECSSCDSSYDKEVLAKYIASTNGGTLNDVFIYDDDNNSLSKYRVVAVDDGESGVTSFSTIIELDLDSNESDAKNTIVQSKSDMLSFVFNVPESIADSAYDLSGSSVTQNNVADYVIANQTWNQAIGHYISAVLSIAGKVVNVNMVIQVEFTNGDIALFAIDGIDANADITLKLVDATDVNNNEVPLTKSEFTDTGEFEFNNETSLQEFSDAALRFGVSISTSGGGGGGLTCSSSGTDAGLTITCIAS